MQPSDKPTSGLQGVNFAVAMFATMFLGTSAVMDAIRSVRLGAASLLVTGLGLWLLFRWLKADRPQAQRFAGAVAIVALALVARVLLSKALVG